jgi:predicted DNA-binding protein
MSGWNRDESRQATFSIGVERIERLKVFAEERGLTRSAVVNAAVDKYLDEADEC